MDEDEARQLFEIKSEESYRRLPSEREGEEGDRRRVFYKGKFYLAEKMRGKWRYFQEKDLTTV